MLIYEQKETVKFNVLREFKYAALLRMFWLHEQNSQINWTTEELNFINEDYNIMKQSEMCLSKHRSWDHEISLISEKEPVWKSLYSMSENQLKKVRNYLDKNLKKEFIRLSKSSAEYSILFVLKKNDKKWLCVNYRQLNNIIKKDSYSLSLIEELQNQLKKAQWFTSLNLKKAYYRVRMKENKEWKTAF